MPRAIEIPAADGTIDAHLFTPAGAQGPLPGVHFITEHYRGAAHGFTAKDAPSYDAAADALHHRRLAMLLEETL
ncbi:dienelactone hydrolase family protein [Halomonas sp.]|uniref:dienelactone hydrolase family protein n=1 Tax=Halomonas sp. TaxID=1486246 RepID=UPI0025B8DF97|nr:dienelactone hydrolase family protein [Halomonas sp.]